MPTYTYAHGGTVDRDRLRLLLGDTKGTNGIAANWIWSDEELADFILLNSQLIPAARLALQSRINREGIAGDVAAAAVIQGRATATTAAIAALDDVRLIDKQGAIQYRREEDPAAIELDTVGTG